MPNRVISWPEGFGFHIYGDGPSYVVSVEKDSDAGRSGLQAGDQILQVNSNIFSASIAVLSITGVLFVSLY